MKRKGKYIMIKFQVISFLILISLTTLGITSAGDDKIFYPCVDGEIDGDEATWGEILEGACSFWVSDDSPSGVFGETDEAYICRSYFTYDTSSIPDTAIIDSVTAYFLLYNNYDVVTFHIFEGNQSTSGLTSDDWNKYMGDSLGTMVMNSAYDYDVYSISLPTTIVDVEGYTQLVAREASDVSGVEPEDDLGATVYYSESEETYMPHIAVKYHLPEESVGSFFPYEDGYVYCFSNSDFNSARLGLGSLGVDDPMDNANIGVGWYDTSFTVTRGFVSFDTSSLPEGITITEAKIRMYIYANQDDTLVIRSWGGGQGVSTGDFNLYGSTDFATLDLSGAGGAEIEVLTLNADGRTHINTDGYTDISIISLADLEYDDSINFENWLALTDYIADSSNEAYPELVPKLIVTYTEGEPETSCGDEECNGDETCETCEADCGECEVEPSCGDEECNGTETCDTCEEDCGECASGSSGSSSISSGIQVEMKSYPKTVEPKESFDIVYEIRTTSPITVRTEIEILNNKNISIFAEENSMLVKKSSTINTSVVKGLEEGDYTIRIKVRNKTTGTYPIKVEKQEETVISFSWLKEWLDVIKEFFKRF